MKRFLITIAIGLMALTGFAADNPTYDMITLELTGVASNATAKTYDSPPVFGKLDRFLVDVMLQATNGIGVKLETVKGIGASPLAAKIFYNVTDVLTNTAWTDITGSNIVCVGDVIRLTASNTDSNTNTANSVKARIIRSK